MTEPSGAHAQPVVIELDEADPTLDFANAVADGLKDRPRHIPCRFLYDKRGSELFEQICDLPEYYLTRTESEILASHAGDICARTGPVTIIELGSGMSVKTDHLLNAYTANNNAVRYVPVDVSEFAIRLATKSIEERHPRVRVSGIVGTYESAFPVFKKHSPSMVVFLGSTIGNLDQEEMGTFWQKICSSLSPGDFFLLGVDLVKDKALLEAAYNDSAGVTAEFLANIFARMNRELGSDIDLNTIEHVAEYDAQTQQIDISAKFLADQEIFIEPLEQSHDILAGESVMLEVSRKFVLEDLIPQLARYGLDTKHVFTDEKGWFGDLLLQRR